MAKLLRAIQPNAGVRAWYRKRLLKEIEAMQRSVAYWLESAYRQREDEIVGDASPARDLLSVFGESMRRWMRRWDTLADWLGRRVVEKVDNSTTTSMREAFKAAGFTVKFDRTRNLNSVTEAYINWNVGLIKSIGREYLDDVRGIVMEGVGMGRDLGYISEQLGNRYDITKRRAKLIARDQTDKATQAIRRVRDENLGITEGIWVHLPGQKTSRKTHEAMNGKRFKLNEGLYDSAVKRNVLPGELVACYPEGSKLHGLPFAEKLYRRWYTGKLAQVVTDDGAILSVTPNHPILTSNGWKAAGLLNIGDHIVKTSSDSLFLAELDANGVVPTFDELFDALVLLGVSPTVLDGSTGDFHGDGIESEIDVIDIDSLLTGVDNTKTIQALCELGFTRPEVGLIAALFSGQRPAQGGLVGDITPVGFMRRCRECLPVFFSRISVAEQISFALCSDNDIIHKKAFANNITANSKTLGNFILTYARLIKGNDFFFRDGIFERLFTCMWNCDTSFPEIFAESAFMHSDLLGDKFDKNAFSYRLASIIDHSTIDFSGHVYNLQTTLGWYIAENTVSRNCRCVYRAVLPEFGD